MPFQFAKFSLQVKVMLRIADNPVTSDEGASSSFLTVDKKKRQVTLSDPSQASLAAASHPSGSQERGPMVAAPKMFAFDGLFTPDDSQVSMGDKMKEFTLWPN